MSVDLRIRKNMVSGDRHFSLDVAFSSKAKRIALFGPSGAGKSLTLRAVAGLLRPDAGRIEVNGRVLFDAEARVSVAPQARRVAYLFQDYALFPHLTVAQNIAFGSRRGWLNPPRRAVSAEARRWVDAFELGAIVGSYPHEISGGQKQRVALARALMLKPEIVLLDEPFSALDSQLRGKMRLELNALQRQLDVPMLLITHDPADVEALADEVFEVRDGKVRRRDEDVGV
ncbi:ATP-binding cassette domain-containing protein [Achromobacter xylosoxidans]|jgi:molybdate transport system ATP-binding protein|uniref:ATP-binding cassette domain-containing protein n=1 Tax=Achromobacter TaxID=222 RepID=UPI00033212B7|nr:MULTISPECIES: ATP-binding cassette domain-containing protein [Achromobacter]AHC49070.1 Molybdenum transport ATP-binding protein ModC [Achromobacter xylosoxidans NBRC 15126 = ATCC 27061]AUZ18694.1 ABC transporter ATP-binding protein [Achromobacter xylosoxidans]AXA79193.1 spermidine/putrescine ABC transporter ATP-binding protein PotA [Achromobacter xylosoxidans]KAA5926469.1 ATP-binding cassette domain-containing protein [Achromobacter xylosoxidans]KMJ92605.1 molybdenum ABC transporter ATPase 